MRTQIRGNRIPLDYHISNTKWLKNILNPIILMQNFPTTKQKVKKNLKQKAFFPLIL